MLLNAGIEMVALLVEEMEAIVQAAQQFNFNLKCAPKFGQRC